MRFKTPMLFLFAACLSACGADDNTNANPWWHNGADGSTDGDIEGGKGGSAGSTVEAGTDGSCIAKTCAMLAANCGSAPDQCGGVVSCGSCPVGQTCGGAGTNKCGAGTCPSKTCAQLGAICGWASDQCSKAIDCGGCAPGQTCGTPGHPNLCSGAGGTGGAGGAAGKGGAAGAADGGPDGATCADDCSPVNSLSCNTGTNAYLICGQYDSDPCLEWSAATPCPSGNTCVDGICKPGSCTNECNQSGLVECVGQQQYHTCGNYDPDICLEWSSSLVSCQPGQVCSSSMCQCTDTCSSGQKECVGASSYHTCAPAGVCNAWGSSTDCPSGYKCDQGACVCDNPCTAGQTRCDPNNNLAVQTCAQLGACLGWQTTSTCNSGHHCSTASGSPTCHDCWPEGPTCKSTQTGYLYFCGDYVGNDGVFELWTDFAANHQCPAGLTCTAGYCAAQAALRYCDANQHCHCCT